MTVEKKRPQRTCIACRKEQDKSLFMRVVKTPEGNVELDLTGRKNGRGAYICRNDECLKKAIKTKAIGRMLKTELSADAEQALLEEMKNFG